MHASQHVLPQLAEVWWQCLGVCVSDKTWGATCCLQPAALPLMLPHTPAGPRPCVPLMLPAAPHLRTPCLPHTPSAVPPGPSQLGSAASPYWRKLQALLDQYDAAPPADGSSSSSSSQQQGTLRLAAVDEVLQVDAHMALPHWLLDMFEVRGPQGLWCWGLLGSVCCALPISAGSHAWLVSCGVCEAKLGGGPSAVWMWCVVMLCCQLCAA